jgi:hypothetical protein
MRDALITPGWRGWRRPCRPARIARRGPCARLHNSTNSRAVGAGVDPVDGLCARPGPEPPHGRQQLGVADNA